MLNHGSLICSSSSSQAFPALALLELGVDLRRRAALDERPVDAAVDRDLREATQLRVGFEQQDVDPGDHLRDVLVGDVREAGLAEIANVTYAPYPSSRNSKWCCHIRSPQRSVRS